MPETSEEEIDLAELAYEDVTEISPDGRAGMLGRYQLCFELASGGMGKVYLARIEGAGGFEKVVALKKIHPHLAEEREFIDMFLDEARLASRIDHPNVCTVFDFGGSGREYYIAMEYLLGETISKLWQRVGEEPEMASQPRWWAIAMRIVAEACEGLHVAHELKNDAGEPLHVVHRDVSPWNVVVTYDGAVKVMDFGVARAAERIHHTRTGQVKGHYAYMAPEQARNVDFDRRADVWSLGVTLWELLTLQRLFDRPNEAATIMAVANGEIPAPSSIRPEIPQALDVLVLKALRRDPTERFATARQMGRELERAMAWLRETVGKGEIAELMESKFVAERARRQRILVDARTLEAGRVLRALEDELELEVFSDVEGATPTRVQQAPTPRAVTAPTPIVAGKPRGRSQLPVLAVGSIGGAVASAALFAALFLAFDAPDEPTATVQEPAAPAIARPEPPQVAQIAPPPPPEVAPPQIAPSEPAEQSEAAVEPEEERPRRRRRPRAPRARPGTVNVVTPGGWAEIFVRGRRVGRSPGRIELPSGPQTITIRPFGTQPPRTVRVDVPSGGTARVSLPVRP